MKLEERPNHMSETGRVKIDLLSRDLERATSKADSANLQAQQQSARLVAIPAGLQERLGFGDRLLQSFDTARILRWCDVRR